MTTRVTTGSYLDRILANTEKEIVEHRENVPLSRLERKVQATGPALSMASALKGNHVGVIAEIKRASPSKGPIASNIVAADVAADYLDGGCSAISVLTDQSFFRGTLDDLKEVTEISHSHAVPRPVLRKDFVIDPYQIYEARAAGADCILLIIAALSDQQYSALHTVATDLGMDSLVEIHDERELERAIVVDPAIIGINNRDLRNFEVSLETTERLAPLVPGGIVIVGESGIRDNLDLVRLGKSGVNAVLVGESLMRQGDRAQAVRNLLE